MKSITCKRNKINSESMPLASLEVLKNNFNKTPGNRITEIKAEYQEWKESVRDTVIIFADRENARLVDIAENRFEFTGDKAYALLPFYVSRYSTSGQKRMKKNIEKRLNAICSGVFLTLTIDPKKYTLLNAWKNLSKLITHALNYIKILKKRDSKKHGKDSKLEYVWVVEAQENGYPHVHVFFLGIQYLLPQIKVAAIWNAGFVFLQKMENVNIGRYMTKYLAKNQGLSNVLPFVWKFKIRMYGMTNMKTVKEEKKEVDYVVLGTCTLKELEGFAWGHQIHQIEFFGGGGLTIGNTFSLSSILGRTTGHTESQGWVYPRARSARLALTLLCCTGGMLGMHEEREKIPF